jgi:predicted nucleic acid-binding protein
MVLVDTTIWIDWLRGRKADRVSWLGALLDEGEAVLAPVIYQEILQGAASPQALRTLKNQFGALPMLVAEVFTYVGAGALYARCRWHGYTPRSPHDCLIAQLAIENRLPLLQDDRDFEHIVEVEPNLVLWPNSSN